MIRSIKIRNFKSLESVDLKLSGLNVFVGTNSSGKSNFLDALRLLQGIGSGFTISEVLNGKPRSATSEVWEGVRGGSEYATFQPMAPVQGEERTIELVVDVAVKNADFTSFEYGIELSSTRNKVVQEWLKLPSRNVFASLPQDSNQLTIDVTYPSGRRGRPPRVQFDRSKPVLHQFAESSHCKASDRRILGSCIQALSDVQRLDPSPDVLRSYSAAQTVARMGEHGENFAALVNSIIGNPEDRDAFVKWLQELSPADVDDVLTLQGALREPLFAVVEGGKQFPAPVLSDGTLRFAAIAAAFFQESMPSVLTLEEIEKGIHPNRLRLLVELLRSQTKRLGCQVIATTHSPDVLDWLSLEDLDSTFVSVRDSSRGCSLIRAIGDMDTVQEALRGKAALSELFSEGWLESIA